MADYHGTSGNDEIAETKLGLSGNTTIYGDDGDDKITIRDGDAAGGKGNDTIIGTTPYGRVVFWGASSAVQVNLATGKASDGVGGTDTLINVQSVAGTPFNDTLIGNANANRFFGEGGSDTIVGGGGDDTVIYWNLKSTDVKISYDAPTSTFTVTKNSPGNTGVDKLTGIARIQFTGPQSDAAIITPEDVTPGFLHKYTHLNIATPQDFPTLQQIIGGDFNGDGKRDLLVVRSDNQAGAAPAPLQVLLGDGKGGFVDGTATVFGGKTLSVQFAPRVVVADFNKDGIDDIFAADFGQDVSPYNGGQNKLFMSSNGIIVDATTTLPQRLAQNHGLSIGDVNKDGYVDLLVNAINDRQSQAESLFINDRSGKLVLTNSALPASLNAGSFIAGHTWSALADLNGDGYDDAVFGAIEGSSTNHSFVLLNDGKGSFANSQKIDLPSSGVTLETVVAIKAVDLNNDGKLDLIMSVLNGGSHDTFYETPYLQILINQGGGQFRDETAARLPQAADGSGGWYKFVDVADLNGDGAPDLVVQAVPSAHKPSTLKSAVFLNDGSGDFFKARAFAADQNGSEVHAVDVNGDGIAEIVFSSGGEFRLYANDLPRVAAAGISHGTSGNDIITARAGNEEISGGAGIDTVVYAGVRADFTSLHEADVAFIVDNKGNGGTDTLMGIERVKFSDMSLAFDVAGTAGQGYRLYQAAFDRTPDLGGLGYWISAMDHGASLHSVAEQFVGSAEFKSLYGSNATNDVVLKAYYQNVLHRPADEAGYKFWLNALDTGAVSLADMLIQFSESAENQAAVIGTIQNGIAYQPFG
jgi:hypothetical protein